MVNTNLSEENKQWFKSFNDPKHRVLRYVLKIGDLEEATHVFVDLLGMRVFSHVEYDEGNADGGSVHYGGQWSRTLVGYGKAEEQEVCLQLTLNHGVTKYNRGNHVHIIEIELQSTGHLEDVGLSTGQSRGKHAYFVNCDGYRIGVVKSDDGKNRISCLVLNCDEPITLSGPTVGFWTKCLGFEIVCWSTDPKNDSDNLIEYTNRTRCRFCCCILTRVMKKRSVFKPLTEGELPYVELQYGCTTNFHLRLQSLPKDVPIDNGTGRERLYLTCTLENLKLIRNQLHTLGRKLRGSETLMSFQLTPGRPDLIGVVATDPSGLQVCFYDDEEVRLVQENQLDAEVFLRQSIVNHKHLFVGQLGTAVRRRSSVRFHM